jgi:hypothetical protein
MNYTQIVNAALAYADRAGDTEILANIDVFLRAVENRLNNRLNVSKMSTRTQLTTVAQQEYYGLPTDFQALRDIEIRQNDTSAERNTLRFLTPEQMNNWISSVSRTQTESIYYTIVADQLHIWPPQDGMLLEIVYYRDVPELSSVTGSTTNWVSDSQPNLYIYGLQVEINSFVKDAASVQLWDARFMAELQTLVESDSVDRWSGTPLQIRPDTTGLN